MSKPLKRKRRSSLANLVIGDRCVACGLRWDSNNECEQCKSIKSVAAKYGFTPSITSTPSKP